MAEMHLIRAESNFRLSSSKGMTPLSEINTLRARSNAKPLSELSIDVIFNERQLELALRVTLYMITKDLVKMLEVFNLMIQNYYCPFHKVKWTAIQKWYKIQGIKKPSMLRVF